MDSNAKAEDTAAIRLLGIAPRFRGKGVGKALTEFGRVWLLRTVALLVLWLSWRTRPSLSSPGISAAMLVAACLIAASRSLSGHAGDWGDITLHELMDWSHLFAASFGAAV